MPRQPQTFSFNGERLTLDEISAITKINRGTLKSRTQSNQLGRDADYSQILSAPLSPGKKLPKKFLYNGVKRSVIEIAELSGKSSTYVYDYLRKLRRTFPSRLNKDHYSAINTPHFREQKIYTVNGKGCLKSTVVELTGLTSNEIDGWYRAGYSLDKIINSENAEMTKNPVIRTKCYNAWRKLIKRYGDNLPEEWKISAAALIDDIGLPSSLTDFIWVTVVEGQITKENIKWAKQSERSQLNTERELTTQETCFIKYQGDDYSYRELAALFNIPVSTLYYRVKRGVDEKDWGKQPRRKNK